MNHQLRNYVKLTMVILALGLSQCGKKTKSQDVLITVVPDKPIVFTTDMSYTDSNGSAVTVKAPWFKFSVSIDNESDTTVTIVGLHIDVTGTDANGAVATVSADFNPETNNYTSAGTPPVKCNYSDFGEFTKGGFSTGCPPDLSGNAVLPSFDGTSGNYLCPAVAPSTVKLPPSFNKQTLYSIPVAGSDASCRILLNFHYSEGNPKPVNNSFIRYTVKVTPVGWFGTRGVQQDRFDNFTTIYTQ